MVETAAKVDDTRGHSEQDVALSLLNMIARAENWWEGEEKPPTRQHILAVYADCVAASKGLRAAEEAVPPSAANDVAPLSNAKVPANRVALYGAVQGLSPRASEAAPELLVIDERRDLRA